MESLVYLNKRGHDVTNSILVAEKFKKDHKNVLRDVRNLDCSNNFHRLNFEQLLRISNLPSGGSRSDEYFEITKDGFSFLVMGYRGSKAAKFKEDFISEFNKRESLLKDDDYILTRALEISANKRMLLEAQLLKKDEAIRELSPKAEYFDQVLSSDSLHNITIVATKLKVTAIELNRWLAKDNIQHKKGSIWIINQEYLDLGYAEYSTFTKTSGNDIKTYKHLKWTELGLKFIYDKYKNKTN